MLYGFQKTTLLDFPDTPAALVFTGGCPFRCPWCHNGSLVQPHPSQSAVAEADVLDHLKKRQGILEGLVVSGGEPLMHPGLSDFLKQVKALGYRIKLDTCGYWPERLEALLRDGLADYVAMDVKNCPDRYAETCGLSTIDITRIRTSLDIVRGLGNAGELRTTVSTRFHDKTSIEAMLDWIGTAERVILQPYRYSENQLQNEDFGTPDSAELKEWIAPWREVGAVQELRIRGFE